MLEGLVIGDPRGEEKMKIMLLVVIAMIGFGVVAYGEDKKTEGTAVVQIKLPKPAYTGTPKNIPPGTTAEKPTGKPRAPWSAPAGVKNLALNRPVTASDKDPIIGKLEQVTDGDKEGSDGSWVELGPGLQWVQIDLGKTADIYGILLWHQHGDPRIYRDVVVQVADDPDFIEHVRTVFNNDQDNSAGLGLGKDNEYFEMAEGKLIEVKGLKARYVRCYSKGSTSDEQNHYIEIEVHGKAGK